MLILVILQTECFSRPSKEIGYILYSIPNQKQDDTFLTYFTKEETMRFQVTTTEWG